MCASLLAMKAAQEYSYIRFSLFFYLKERKNSLQSFSPLLFYMRCVCWTLSCISLSSARPAFYPFISEQHLLLIHIGVSRRRRRRSFFFFRGPHLLILSFSFPFFLGLYLPAGRRFLFKGKTGAAIVRKKKKKKRKRDKKKLRKVKLIITLTRSLIYIAQRTGISCRQIQTLSLAFIPCVLVKFLFLTGRKVFFLFFFFFLADERPTNAPVSTAMNLANLSRTEESLGWTLTTTGR